MILGLDMGGTHTDAVVINGKNIIKTVKIPTRGDILSSLLEAIENVTQDGIKNKISRLVLSTTLTTNAIVQNKMNEVGMVIMSGPGLPKEYLKINENTHFISGYIDHRGTKVTEWDKSHIADIKKEFQQKGIKYAGIVTKFSPRNGNPEEEIKQNLGDTLNFAALGQRVSGNLNFPRRINTAFLNASVYELHKKFVDSVLEALKQKDIHVPVYMLKADGGTVLIEESIETPAQTITSGPAASIMGILGLVPNNECIVAIDIGGTTSDIAIIHKRAPLLEPEGITISEYKTLIRALFTQSIGVGGDSIINYENNSFTVGPERKGPAFCMGGTNVTPTDAARFLNLSEYGDISKAKEIIENTAKTYNLSSEETAKGIIKGVVNKISNTVKEMVNSLNSRPVYTIHELIEGKEIKPTVVAVVGGPASVFGEMIAKELNCKLIIPENDNVANAIGAAISRTTTEVNIHADTAQGWIKCIEEEKVESAGRGFNLQDALAFAKKTLLERVKKLGANDKNIDIEITEAQSFNMVEGWSTSGRNIRVKAQVKPGIIKEFS